MASEQSLREDLARIRLECPPNDPRLERPLLRLANWYSAHRQLKAVEPLLLELLRLRLQVYGQNHPTVALTLSQLSILASLEGDFTRVESLLLQAIKCWEEQSPVDLPQLINSINQLAESYYQQSQFEKSFEMCKRAMRLADGLNEEHVRERIRTLNNLGSNHVIRREMVLAERLFQQNVRICQRLYRADDPVLATHYNNLAEVLRLRGKFEESEKLMIRALQIWRKAHGIKHHLYAQGILNLALLRNDSGYKHNTVEVLLRKSLEVRLLSFAPSHPTVSKTLKHLAEYLTAHGRQNEIDELQCLTERQN